MKIMMKCDISSLYLTFCHDFFMESLRVFSYDLENSCCCQKTTQNNPINCESDAVQMYSEFWEILGFIAWRFHMEVPSPRTIDNTASGYCWRCLGEQHNSSSASSAIVNTGSSQAQLYFHREIRNPYWLHISYVFYNEPNCWVQRQ